MDMIMQAPLQQEGDSSSDSVEGWTIGGWSVSGWSFEGWIPGLIVFAKVLLGAAYALVGVCCGHWIYTEARKKWPAFGNDGCLVVLLPLLSLAGGILWPLVLLGRLLYDLLAKACGEGGSCCGFSYAAFKARRAQKEREEYGTRLQEMDRQQPDGTQQCDDEAPPAYSSPSFPRDLEAGRS